MTLIPEIHFPTNREEPSKRRRSSKRQITPVPQRGDPCTPDASL
jgi:hypothetical protein